MSSLLDKIKSAVNASLRGPRHSKPAPESPTADIPRPTALPEVMDADPHEERLPEVTEAPLAEAPMRPSPTPPGDAESRVVEKRQQPESSDDLEDERIVDLLQDNQA